MFNNFKPENRLNTTKKITPEKRDEYVITAMVWSKKMVSGDIEGAFLLKKKLLQIEKELSMTAEEIIGSKLD